MFDALEDGVTVDGGVRADGDGLDDMVFVTSLLTKPLSVARRRV